MRNEMRLRDWLVDLWEGLVWFGLVFYYIHTSFFDVLAWAQFDKRGCDVLSSPSSLLKFRFGPLQSGIRKERTPADL